MITHFRYVAHEDLPRMTADGWRKVTDLGHPHGAYAVLCQWFGEGEPA